MRSPVPGPSGLEIATALGVALVLAGVPLVGSGRRERGGAPLEPDRSPADSSEAVATIAQRAVACSQRAEGEVRRVAAPASPALHYLVGSEAATLRVRVTRLARGVPAQLEIVHNAARGVSTRQRRVCDAQGTFELALEPGCAQIVAWLDDACALPARTELAAGGTHEVELELAPALPVAGCVRDAQTGRPIAGAAVAFWTFAEHDGVKTGADGSFRHPRFPPRAPAQQIAVIAPGYGRSVRVLRVEENGAWKLGARGPDELAQSGVGTPWIEFELEPEQRLHGRVMTSAGTPLAGARVTVEGYFQILAKVAARDGAEALSDSEGRFEFGGLRSDIGHAVLVEAPGFARATIELAPRVGAHDLGSVCLARETLLAGAVVDSSGTPAGGVEVVVRTLDQEAVLGSARDVGVRFESREQRTRTASDGSFAFEGLAAAPCELAVEGEAGETRLVLEPRADGTFEAPCLVLEPPLALVRPRR